MIISQKKVLLKYLEKSINQIIKISRKLIINKYLFNHLTRYISIWIRDEYDIKISADS